MQSAKLDFKYLQTFLANCGPGTKVYLGCDSERFMLKGVAYADYILAVVVHINGRNGCKLFGEIHRERVYDQRLGRPAQRLMNEVMKVSELYHQIKDHLNGFACEIHLDINPDEDHGSNCVVSQAIGYIIGTCQLTPKIKPEAFAASSAADRYKSLGLAIAA